MEKEGLLMDNTENLEYYLFADSLAESYNVENISEEIRQDMRRYSRTLIEREDTA